MKKMTLILMIFSLVFVGCGGNGGDQLTPEEQAVVEQALIGVMPAVNKALPSGSGSNSERETYSDSVEVAGMTLAYKVSTSTFGNTVKTRTTITAAFDEGFSTNVDIKYGDNNLAKTCAVSLTGKAKLDIKSEVSNDFSSLDSLSASTKWDVKFFNPNASGLRLKIKNGSETILDKKVTFRFTTLYTMGASMDGIQGKAEAYAKINGEEIADGGLMANFSW